MPSSADPLPSLGARTVSVVRAHPAATAWVLFAAVAALAYRHLVGPGPLEGGVVPSFAFNFCGRSSFHHGFGSHGGIFAHGGFSGGGGSFGGGGASGNW